MADQSLSSGDDTYNWVPPRGGGTLFGLGGNDSLTLTGNYADGGLIYLTDPFTLDGGAGDDTLLAGTGNVSLTAAGDHPAISGYELQALNGSGSLFWRWWRTDLVAEPAYSTTINIMRLDLVLGGPTFTLFATTTWLGQRLQGSVAKRPPGAFSTIESMTQSLRRGRRWKAQISRYKLLGDETIHRHILFYERANCVLIGLPVLLMMLASMPDAW